MAYCNHCKEDVKTILPGNKCGWCGRALSNNATNTVPKNLSDKKNSSASLVNRLTSKIKTLSGKEIEYSREIFATGAMKDAHFGMDKNLVILLYRDKQGKNTRDRLEKILRDYNPTLDPEVGKYWGDLFCWPKEVLLDGDTIGVLVSKYPESFFIKKGFGAGKPKEGKWFASAKIRKYLDPEEKGDWEKYFRINIKLARSVRKLHAIGLAHSDLSYKNVLIDPKLGNSLMIDIDNLVVQGKFLPEVLGTPDFVAPEVIKTQHLTKEDPKRFLPGRTTDLHALAVLIYMYLLYRHPLKGGKMHDLDTEKDDHLAMGEKALFIENPTDLSNRTKDRNPSEMPWIDTNKIPYSVCGPYIKELFDKAFIEGLHNPERRPSASAWEEALIKTLDLLIPCNNKSCEQKFFIHNFSAKPSCPFCGTNQNKSLPVLNFYKPKRGVKGQYTEDKTRLVVYNNKPMYIYHADTSYIANEKLQHKNPVVYFLFENGKWYLKNISLEGLKDVGNNKLVPINSSAELIDGKQFILSNSPSGRVIFVQIPK